MNITYRDRDKLMSEVSAAFQAFAENKLMIEKVEDEVARAYCDCHDHSPNADRNLDFSASKAIPLWEAIRIMQRYVKEYNNFEWHLLAKLPENSTVVIAREGSVCMYIKTPILLDKPQMNKLIKDMKVDEFSQIDDSTIYRLWWD